MINLKEKEMKKYLNILYILIIASFAVVSCSDFPVDEDGLLITTRDECYVSNFDLLDSDFQTVRTKSPVIDTTAQTINIEVHFGTNLKKLHPQFSLVTDAKLDPKIVGFEDFSNLANPKKWTVVSGSRRIRKEYSVFITVQQP
jgi:hypothetical protein